MSKQIELGHRVKDRVTGIKGHVVQKAQWLTGCDTVAIEPDPIEGKKQDAIILDINRVKYVDAGVRAKFFTEQKDEIEDIGQTVAPVTGGPHEQLRNPKEIKKGVTL